MSPTVLEEGPAFIRAGSVKATIGCSWPRLGDAIGEFDSHNREKDQRTNVDVFLASQDSV